jgi:hypothetical protein
LLCTLPRILVCEPLKNLEVRLGVSPSTRQLPFQQHYRTLADVGDAVVRSYPLSSKGKSEIRTVFVPEQLIPT